MSRKKKLVVQIGILFLVLLAILGYMFFSTIKSPGAGEQVSGDIELKVKNNETTSPNVERETTKEIQKETSNETKDKATAKTYIKAPEEPEKTGYVFGGWMYKDEENIEREFDFTKPVHGNYKLYAKWYKEDSAKGKLIIISKKIKEQGGNAASKIKENVTSKDTVTKEESLKVQVVRATINTAFYSFMPLLFILLLISIFRDLKTIHWYRNLKKEALANMLRRLQ